MSRGTGRAVQIGPSDDPEGFESVGDRSGGLCCGRVRGDALVELADAGNLRAEDDLVCTGAGFIDFEQNFAGWTASPCRRRTWMETTDGRALGEDEPGGTREDEVGHEGAVGLSAVWERENSGGRESGGIGMEIAGMSGLSLAEMLYLALLRVGVRVPLAQ